MAGRFIPPSEQYFDNSGNVLSGGLLYFYDSGTAVAKDTYSDPDGTIANTNPVVLDAAGRTPNIYLDGAYKLIIRDSAGVQIEERDPVLAADDTTKGFSAWNAVTTYSVDDIVRASNNLLYISIANSNQNNEPSASATKWTQVRFIRSYNANETYAIGDIVADSIGNVYRSLANSNTGNTPSSSPASWTSIVAGAFSGNVTVGGTLGVTGEASFDDRILLQEASVTRWAISPFSGALDVERYNSSGVFQDKGFTLDSSGNLLAGTDNTKTLGGASNRWSVVYAGTGTINTSDAREKTTIRVLTADELRASKLLAKEIGVYKWLAAVEEKGDSARRHIGLTVQKAIEIMESCNLAPSDYGFICYDEWTDEFVEHPAIEAAEAKEDSPAVEAVEAWTEQVKWAGNRYGFRYDELINFVAAGFNARLEALEAK